MEQRVNYRQGFALIAVLVLTLLINKSAWAVPTTLDFTELPFQPVDGVSIAGVTFDFKIGGIDSLDANYASGGPGSITFVQDPSLEGNAAGILTLDFAAPTPILSFGVALSIFGTLTPGFTVELFDASLISLGITPVTTNSLISFTEAQFNYGGPPILRAVLDFDETAAPLRFAFDNLTFDVTAIPEPASIFLMGIGVAGLSFLRWRRKAALETRRQARMTTEGLSNREDR